MPVIMIYVLGCTVYAVNSSVPTISYFVCVWHDWVKHCIFKFVQTRLKVIRPWDLI